MNSCFQLFFCVCFCVVFLLPRRTVVWQLFTFTPFDVFQRVVVGHLSAWRLIHANAENGYEVRIVSPSITRTSTMEGRAAYGEGVDEDGPIPVPWDQPPPRKRAKKKSKKRRRDEEDLAPPQKKKRDVIGFQHGHAIVSGASGCGKTKYTVDAILGEGVHDGHEAPWDAVVVMCDNVSIDQEEYKRLKKKFTGPGGVTFIEGIPVDHEEGFLDMLRSNKNNGWHTLVIVDDLMNDTKVGPNERFVTKLFTSARHQWADVWELTQNHTGVRTRRHQVAYLMCFRVPSDVRSIAHLARSVRPETGGHDIMAAYRVATESHDGHGCLVMCLNQPNEFMFRNTCMDVCFDLNGVPVTKDGTPVIGANLYP